VKSFSKESTNYEEAFSFTYQEKKELETRIEELEDEVEMEREEAEKALDAAMR
jgi:predicted nuclease with TOPRIM domain